MFSEILKVCDTVYEISATQKPLSVKEFRWNLEDLSDECVLLGSLKFPPEIVSKLVTVWKLKNADVGALNRIGYYLYHTAQASKKRVAAKAGRGGTLQQKIVSGFCLIPFL